jgi:hypothetical protein
VKVEPLSTASLTVDRGLRARTTGQSTTVIGVERTLSGESRARFLHRDILTQGMEWHEFTPFDFRLRNPYRFSRSSG